ncbi:MAG: hypothetical protein ACOCZJ_03865 [Thermoplasmatota archaeon]
MINDMIQRNIPTNDNKIREGTERKDKKKVSKGSENESFDSFDIEDKAIKYLLLDVTNKKIEYIMLEGNLVVDLNYKGEEKGTVTAGELKEEVYNRLVEENRDKFSWANTTSRNPTRRLIKEYDELDEEGIYGLEKESIEKIVDLAFDRS